MSTVKYLCRVPSIPGPDVVFPAKHLAEREAKNARALGHQADVEEVLVRVALRMRLARVVA